MLSEIKQRRKTNAKLFHLYVKSKNKTNEKQNKTETDSYTQRTSRNQRGGEVEVDEGNKVQTYLLNKQVSGT